MYSRLNYLRIVLALAVVAGHMYPLQFLMAGPLAVWCFFLISGFLVSKILNENYQGRPGDFVKNRFLRIFPMYWVALTIGVCLLVLDPIGIRGFSKMPEGYANWFSNIFIFDLSSPIRVVDPAWSLAIELNWYLILFVASFLPKRWLLAFLLANLLLPLPIMFLFDDTLYKFGSGFAFSLGALAYHVPIRIPKILQWILLPLLPLLMFVVPGELGISAFGMKSLGANASLLGMALLLFLVLPWFLSSSDNSRLSNFAGELSYPVFVLHPFAGWAAAKLLDNPGYGWPLLSAATAICLLMSVVAVRLVEHPIAKVRSRIRSREIHNGTDKLTTQNY